MCIPSASATIFHLCILFDSCLNPSFVLLVMLDDIDDISFSKRRYFRNVSWMSTSVYCITTRDTHITRDMCMGIHISLWHPDTLMSYRDLLSAKPWITDTWLFSKCDHSWICKWWLMKGFQCFHLSAEITIKCLCNLLFQHHSWVTAL